MNYTPGPWTFRHAEDLGMSEHDDPLGSRMIEAGHETLLMGVRYYPGTPDNIADWHLIAAAPDLLEALKRLHETGLVRDLGTPENKAALAAIAKAEGR